MQYKVKFNIIPANMISMWLCLSFFHISKKSMQVVGVMLGKSALGTRAKTTTSGRASQCKLTEVQYIEGMHDAQLAQVMVAALCEVVTAGKHFTPHPTTWKMMNISCFSQSQTLHIATPIVFLLRVFKRVWRQEMLLS